MGGSVEDDSLLQRERVSVLLGVDELVALSGGQAAHLADGAVDGLAAVGWQLLELLKELTGALLLIRGEMLPGFHAAEHALLLLRRQAGKMLQLLLQPRLLLRREPAELGIVFQRATLLRGWEILVAAEPVSGVAGLVLGRMSWIGAAGADTTFFLKVMPLAVRGRRLLMLLMLGISVLGPRGLGEQERQQQKCRQTAYNFLPAQHSWSLHSCLRTLALTLLPLPSYLDPG